MADGTIPPDPGFKVEDDDAGQIARTAELARLASLEPLTYDQQRKKLAGKAGVRVGTLDAEVENVPRRLRPARHAERQQRSGEVGGFLAHGHAHGPAVARRAGHRQRADLEARIALQGRLQFGAQAGRRQWRQLADDDAHRQVGRSPDDPDDEERQPGQ